MCKLLRIKKSAQVLLAVIFSAVGLSLVYYCRSNSGVNENWSLATSKSEGYVLAFSYMDQATWGARRVRGLQCWTSGLQRDMRVVEPFVRNGSFLGLPPDPLSGANPKFSDIVDLDRWNDYGKSYGKIARWEEFLQYAPRYTILVQIVYEKSVKCSDELLKEHIDCDLERVKQYWSKAMASHSFTVIKELCIKFQKKRDFMTVLKFSQLIFANIPKELPVTLVFNEYRGHLKTFPPAAGEYLTSERVHSIVNKGRCGPSERRAMGWAYI